MHECMKNANRVSVGKREIKRPLARLKRRWDGNVQMDMKNGGCWCEVVCLSAG
jgi:hypothetical protein